MNKKEISSYFSKLGKKGGNARAKLLTPEKRIKIARSGGKNSWKKNKITLDG